MARVSLTIRSTLRLKQIQPVGRENRVIKLLGHEKLKTTMRYAKVDEEKAFESYRENFGWKL